MPSYRSLLVLAFAASAVTPILAAEEAIRPLKNNEGRASSRLELLEREGLGEDPQPPAAKKGFKLGWKMKTVIGTALVVNGVLAWALVSNHEANKALKANQSNSTTPPSSATPPSNTPQQNYGPSPNEYLSPYGYPQTEYSPPNYGDQTTNQSQQNYENASTNPTQETSGPSNNLPSTNSGPNSRREDRPRGRRSESPVSKARQEARSFSDNVRRTSSHLDLLSRADLGEALDLFSRMLDKLD